MLGREYPEVVAVSPMDAEHPLKVLLVEDSPLLADRLRELLAQIPGVTLTGTVNSENSAVLAIRTGNSDVVILDLHLKQGTGFGVLRSTAADAWRPAVIILTNYALPQYQREARSLGVEYFLDKAREFERIPDVLREIAGKGHSVSQ
jgi:DNA-binding NarL/FixJ family response regulator